tara:strand:- start:747 stop:1181 length:435 start_codon:yes stop_codon:yes gene_type:complete
MKCFRIFPIVFFLCLSFSCEKDDESSNLGAEAEKWTSYGFSNYDFTLQISCFCIVDYTQPKRIQVRDNKVISFAGVPFEELNDSSFRTIDGFFLYIEEQRKLNPVVEEIQYDDEYGFPSYIYFDISERIADEEIGYTLTDFVPY